MPHAFGLISALPFSAPLALRFYFSGYVSEMALSWFLAFAGSIALLRLAGRLVIGEAPKLSSAIFALLVSGLITGLTLYLNRGAKFSLEMAIAAGVIAFFVHAAVYSFILEGKFGVEVTFAQGALILLIQWVITFALAAGGDALGALPAHKMDELWTRWVEQSTPPSSVPEPLPESPATWPHPATLRAPVTVKTRYGNIQVPVGTRVTLREEVAQGYFATLSGEEVVLRKEQVTVDP